MNSLKALIVDDDVMLAHAYRLSLQATGFETHLVLSAYEMMEWLAQAVPDLILLDMNLPDGFGAELLPHLRAMLPPSTRIIAITGQARYVDIDPEAFDLVLMKPVSLRQLQQLANRLCEPLY